MFCEKVISVYYLITETVQKVYDLAHISFGFWDNFENLHLSTPHYFELEIVNLEIQTQTSSLWPSKAALLESWEKKEAFSWQLLDYRHYTDVSIIRKICKREYYIIRFRNCNVLSKKPGLWNNLGKKWRPNPWHNS